MTRTDLQTSQTMLVLEISLGCRLIKDDKMNKVGTVCLEADQQRPLLPNEATVKSALKVTSI